MNALLVAGLPALDEPTPTTPVEKPAAAPTQVTLTLAQGFELALDEENGNCASTDTTLCRHADAA